MPTPTKAQLDARLLASGQTPAPYAPAPTAPTPIAVTSLSNPPAPLTVATPVAAPIPPLTPPVAPTAPATPTATAAPITSLETLTAELSGKTLDTATAKAAATAPFEKQLSDITAQISKHSADFLARQEAALKAGETLGYATREAQNVQRTDAIEMLRLSAIQAGLQGNIALAEKHAQTAIDTKYGQLEQDIQAAKQNIYTNWGTFTDAEKKRAQATLLQLDANDSFVKNQREDDKTTAGFVQQAIMQGQQNGNPVPTVILNRASTAANPTEALQLLAPYLVDADAKASALLDLQYKRAQLNKLNAEARALDPNVPRITNSQAGQYSTALSIILGSSKFTKDQKTSVINAVNNGEDPFTTIKNQAKNIMGQTEATTVTKYETAKSALQDLQASLADFYANGGQTNIFSGNYEKVINKLGEVNDPKLVDLAVQIQANLQVYRNAVSGTAYSEQEGKDIASIFPGINKSQGLNEAILSGRMKAFDSTIDGAYRATLGSTYDSLKTSTASKLQQPIAVVSPSGVIGTIPKAQLGEALKSGYKLPAAAMDHI